MRVRVVGLLVGAVVFVLGVLCGRALDALGTVHVDWLRWFSAWSRSAGFGGVAAIVAASIAFLAARQNAKRQERADRKNHWWARAQWVLDATLQDSPAAKKLAARGAASGRASTRVT